MQYNAICDDHKTHETLILYKTYAYEGTKKMPMRPMQVGPFGLLNACSACDHKTHSALSHNSLAHTILCFRIMLRWSANDKHCLVQDQLLKK